MCGDGRCDFGEDSCTCGEDCPDDPSSCSYCECGTIDFSPSGTVSGNGPVACGCDTDCETRGDCCYNYCDTCGDCNGACCLGNNHEVAGGTPSNCVQTSFINCLKGYGGSYLGDGTTCDNNPCQPEPTGACCYAGKGGTSLLCEEMTSRRCMELDGSSWREGVSCTANTCNPNLRLDTVKKGSLLVFPAVELRWATPTTAGPAPVLVQETFITLVNDFSRDVYVKLYFVNGDPPAAPIYADALQTILIERGHNGWNQVDCGIHLTENESTYLALSSGVGGCQRFTILDPGTPPGRPGGEIDGNRVLRGFVIAFAVDENQQEISHNHLSGHVDIVNYQLRSAWEYQAYAFQARNPSTGTPTDGNPGQLLLDGVEYDFSFNTLLFDFFAVGSTALSNSGVTVMLDSDLTLLPASVDLRQDSCGPVTTKAHFDIWNANEDFRSGTTRCITCWDQTLLSAYSLNNGLDNNFILADLGTDKGKARIDGMASFECDNLFVPPTLDEAIRQWLLQQERLCERISSGQSNAAGFPNGNHVCCEYSINDSQNVSLLGVAAKILNFSGAATGTTWAGMNLVGAGQQAAKILFDIPSPPEPARDGSIESSKNLSENNRVNSGSTR